MGSLQMFDDQSGRPLTLWQRATRKYQGAPEGKRAYILAKMEFIRAQALHRQQLQLAAKTKTEPPGVKRAPASLLREKH